MLQLALAVGTFSIVSTKEGKERSSGHWVSWLMGKGGKDRRCNSIKESQREE